MNDFHCFSSSSFYLLVDTSELNGQHLYGISSGLSRLGMHRTRALGIFVIVVSVSHLMARKGRTDDVCKLILCKTKNQDKKGESERTSFRIVTVKCDNTVTV